MGDSSQHERLAVAAELWDIQVDGDLAASGKGQLEDRPHVLEGGFLGVDRELDFILAVMDDADCPMTADAELIHPPPSLIVQSVPSLTVVVRHAAIGRYRGYLAVDVADECGRGTSVVGPEMMASAAGQDQPFLVHVQNKRDTVKSDTPRHRTLPGHCS